MTLRRFRRIDALGQEWRRERGVKPGYLSLRSGRSALGCQRLVRDRIQPLTAFKAAGFTVSSMRAYSSIVPVLAAWSR